MAISSLNSKTGNLGQSETPEVKNIVFIDGAVDEARLLWDDLDPATVAVILDPTGDGVVQITQYLQEYIRQKGGGGNLHIVSHGAPGCLYLGNTQLSLDTLEQYWGDLQQWQVDSLLLYGCQVAAGDAGEELLAKLHAATGANIGASKSKTGNARKGGNWNLEATVGEVKSPVVFSQTVQNAYPGVLADVNISITDDRVDGDTSSISALIASPGADGGISLREAVIAANNTAGDDKIILVREETYNLSIAGTDEDAAATGDLDIADNGKITITIEPIIGFFSEPTVIDANGNDRVFEVLDGASLVLNSVEVTGGNASGSSPNNRGGGVLVNRDGTLELNSSTMNGNTADWGGGIFNLGGTATLNSSTVNDNTANNGGGIFNFRGTATLNSSTVNDNTANNGGGIFNFRGTATLNSSTVNDNTANNGGGIFNRGTATLNSSTVNDNTAANNGGGIFNRGTARLDSSTVLGNAAANNGDDIFNRGTVQTISSVIGGQNPIGNNNGITEFANGVNGDIVGTAASPVDPILGPLQDNGGETFTTHELFALSPAIDAGNDKNIPIDELDVDGNSNIAELLDINQRGATRMLGGMVNIGAYEYLDSGTASIANSIMAVNAEDHTSIF